MAAGERWGKERQKEKRGGGEQRRTQNRVQALTRPSLLHLLSSLVLLTGYPSPPPPVSPFFYTLPLPRALDAAAAAAAVAGRDFNFAG